ncbi:MAG TPA: 16S rRNA (adenine(1518)-N(6)/adenine(1519)-N(6))-dimethyltransferase RsmA [Pyrinomonadaceae bacterium]|nr:16S rRNA (adenine(1518)-N(6)/adenine(1519)-N(6))-dimethyltransferase RsmA [Pyrinomonadaceae bacterium]
MTAKKSLGQNFLVDRGVAARIVGALAPRAGEVVIEIGPGRGALTDYLVASEARLVAVEFDRELVPRLREKYGGRDSFSVVEADALRVDYCALIAPAGQARLISNLPYNISTAVVGRLIEQRGCVPEMVLMLQREVVERITAPPSTGERGFLSVLVQTYCEVETLFDVAPGAFRPVPKVWSTVVRLRTRVSAVVFDERLFLKLLSAAFAQRRKTIANNLRAAPAELKNRFEGAGGIHAMLGAANIAPERRAETLTLEEWAALASKV